MFDEEAGGYLHDAILLDRLVQQKLESVAETIRAEGWSWNEAQADFDCEARSQFHRCHAEQAPLSDAETTELNALEAEYDTLRNALYEAGEDDDPAVAARLEAIEDRVAGLTERPDIWTPSQMANAGAVIHLSSDGEAKVERGFIRPDGQSVDNVVAAGVEAPDATSRAATLPATLVADLTARKTATMRVMFTQRPDIALAAVTYALARSAFYDHGGATCLCIIVKQRSLSTSLVSRDECNGLFAFDAERGKWADRLPVDAEDLWAWCNAQTQGTLLDLLAVSAAHTVDAVHEKGMQADSPRLLHADALAKALHLDMREWFTPTVANYFGRVRRTFIMDALSEAGLPERRSWAKLRKSELAALAEREIQASGWPPQLLRPMAEGATRETGQNNDPVDLAA